MTAVSQLNRRPAPGALLRSASALALCMALVVAPIQSAMAVPVVWNPNADGFWDIVGNWSPGLPGVADDVTISVGGATVRTITFRTGTVTINSLASDEDLLVTGGELIVNNAYTNTQATRLQVGTLRLNGVSTLASLNHTGGVLTGTGVVTVTGAASFNNAAQRGTGQTIVLGVATIGTSGFTLDDGRLLEFRGGATTSGSSFFVDVDPFGPANGGTLRNAAGSVFVDSTSSSGTIRSVFGGGGFENAGTYQKTGAGTTTVSTAFTNSGTVSVEAGTFRVNAALAGSTSTTLNGGVWRVVASPGGSVLDFETTTGITTLAFNSADITLSGVGSQITSGSPQAQIDATLVNNNTTGALRIVNGRVFNATAFGGNFGNLGLLELNNGTFSAAQLTNTGTGTVRGFGNITGPIINDGTLRAAGGTLFTQRITGTGTVRVDPGATLDISGSALNHTAGTLINNGVSLNLGTRTIVVSNDYQNAAFGTGNAFDARANVAGTGVINATSATQVLSATGLTNGNSSGPTLDLGNRRVGDMGTVTVTITNGGAATTLRGAVRDAAAPGVAVTGGDSFTIAPGGSTTFDVGFTGSAPGTLLGQSLVVANNFANVLDQTVGLQGSVFRIAVAALSPNPVNLGNVRQNSTPSGVVNISNTAVVDGFSEGLAVLSAAAGGNAIAGAIPGGVLPAGSSSFATVGIDTTQAGSRTGTVSFALASDGTGTSGLAPLSLGSQAVTVNAAVFALANPDLPAGLAFGNRRVGDTATAVITVSNPQLAGVPAGFQEGLNITTGTVSGPFAGAGTVTNLAAGSSNGIALAVSMDTATVGNKVGTANYLLASNGSGTSGLATLSLPGDSVTLSGAVFRTATVTVSPAPAAFNVRVGDTATRIVTIANSAANDGFSEQLGVGGSTSGPGVNFTGANGLIAAGSNRQVTATVDTATAGAKTGTLNLVFTSDGTGTSGLAALGIGSQAVTINAGVFAAANPGLPTTLAFGNRRVGDVASLGVVVTNAALAGVPAGFQESLDAGVASVSPGFAASGSVTNLAAGGTNPSAVRIALDTSSAGARAGTATIALATNGSGTSGLPTAGLASGTIALSGDVYRTGSAALDPSPVNLGNVRLGTAANGIVTIANTALNDGFSEGIVVTAATPSGAATAGAAPAGVIASGGSAIASVGIDTSVAGNRTGTVSFGLASDGTGTSGLAQLTLASQAVTVNAGVFAAANPNLPATLAFGNRRVGDVASLGVTVINAALAGVPVGFQEGLNASVSAISAGFAASGSLTNLAAGATNASVIQIALDTATAGARSGTASLALATNGAGTSGLPTEALNAGTIGLSGAVFALANPIAIADLGFGNVQQGTVQTRTISVENRLLGGVMAVFQEGLNAGFQSLAPGFSGAGTITNLAAGTTDTTTLVVSLDTSSTGSRSGIVTISFASNGATTSGLGLLDLASQDFAASANVQGTVFRLAQASVAPTFVDFGNRRVGDAAPTAVSIAISNTAINDGFSERLDASVAGTTGRATGSGIVTLLAPQASSGIDVGVDTSVAGANGSVTIALASNGAGTSGFGTTPLAPQVVTLGGGVYRAAQADVAGAATLTARVGDVATTTVTIANVATADGFSESLGVVGSAAGNVSFGNANGLVAAGAVRNVTATVDTATSGVKSGTLSLAFTSDGTGTSGLTAIAAGNGSVTVDANVYAAAAASIGTTTIDFGVVRVGDTASRMTNIANTATGSLTDTLVATVGATPAGFTASASAVPIVAGDSSAIVVTLSTAAAGAFGGNLGFDFASRNPVLADLALSGQSIALLGTVNSRANAVFQRAGAALTFDAGLGGYVFDFGTRKIGSALTLADFSLANIVVGPADVLSGVVDDTSSDIFSIAGPFTTGSLLAGNASGPFAVSVDTSAVGSFTGELRFAGVGSNTSDPLGEVRSARLFLSAKITAVPEPSSWLMLITGFGAIGGGMRRRRVLTDKGCAR